LPKRPTLGRQPIFWTIGRMSATYSVRPEDPYTIGGTLNMVSTPVPETQGGQVTLEAAQDATYRHHANNGRETIFGHRFGQRLKGRLGVIAECFYSAISKIGKAAIT
jgi:outer membrane receptor for Fe3+-dicitrate